MSCPIAKLNEIPRFYPVTAGKIKLIMRKRTSQFLVGILAGNILGDVEQHVALCRRRSSIVEPRHVLHVLTHVWFQVKPKLEEINGVELYS